jgi:hypothetical protein
MGTITRMDTGTGTGTGTRGTITTIPKGQDHRIRYTPKLT